MNPANPGCVAHFHTGQQHPVKGDEHRNLNHDRETATHRVHFFFTVDAHHLLLHLLWIVFQALTHFHDARVDRLHLGHAGIRLGIQPVKRRLQQQH